MGGGSNQEQGGQTAPGMNQFIPKGEIGWFRSPKTLTHQAIHKTKHLNIQRSHQLANLGLKICSQMKHTSR